MQELRPNQARAQAAVILLWVMFALEIASFVSGYFQYNLLNAISGGDHVSDEAASLNDLREQVIGIIFIIAYIISAVTFIMWFRRAYYNLHQRVKFLSQTEGWAAGAWFVPFISLYMPYQIMKELYEKTRKALGDNGIPGAQELNTSLLGWWWALWIINNFMGQLVFRVTLEAETVNQLITASQIGMVSNLIGIPLALLAIKVVRDYAAVEPLLFEIREEPVPVVPPAETGIQGTEGQATV